VARRAAIAAIATTSALACALAVSGAARAQVLDDAGGAPPPGIPALYCPDCEKPPRVRVLPRLALPLVTGFAYGETPRAGLAWTLGVRPELTIGRVSEREQIPGRAHVGPYAEALMSLPWSRGPLVGGGATVAVTTGEITGASLSLGAYARRHELDAAEWRAGAVASLYFGVWMPDVTLPLVPTLGVRVDARYGGHDERALAVSLQIDPVVVGLMLAGL
jgi:hypothetical protein